MTTEDFIIDLFCRIDDQMQEVPKHSQAHLWPSETVTVGALFALKGVGERPFYRWLSRDYRPLFPRLPERSRLLRLLRTHRAWTYRFLAAPTLLGVIDTYGIELLHPRRYGRSPTQWGRKGISNHRWIVGGKLCLLLNRLGLIVGWSCGTANVYDTLFHPLVEMVKSRMVVLADHAVSCGGGRSAEPQNLSAGAVERPNAGRNSPQHEDFGQPPQACAASVLGLLDGPARLPGNGRQSPAAVAWPTCRRAGL